MSKKIAIVADTTCDLPNRFIEEYNIKLMPLRVIYKDRDYRDRYEITPEEVCDNLNKEIPTTSLPVAEDVLHIFDELVEEGYTDAIVLTLTSKVSGTYNLATLLAKEYKGLDIEVIDSKAVSIFYGFMVLEGARYAHTGNKTLIKEKIMTVRKRVRGCHLIDTLTYLKKGGRIGKVQGTVAEILNIKPIIGIDDKGVYQTFAKIRGRKRAIKAMIDMVKKQFSHKAYKLVIVHGNVEEDAKAMYEELKDIGEMKEFFMTKLCSVSCVHTGPGIIGYVAYEI